MKQIAVLGSTGSIGKQTLDVVRMHPDLLSVTALGCGSNISLLEQQIREFKPALAAVYDEDAAAQLKEKVSDLPVRIVTGMDGLIEMCGTGEAEIVVTAIVGMIGIRPTIAAIEAGKDIALANKETLVTAGHLIMPLAKQHNVRILPVDSEHSAIFQSLQGCEGSRIAKILLTASGGPFRHMERSQLENVTVKEALAHPTWQMGPKITIDSATMVNKGLEVIEACRLFDVTPEQVQVVIQPQSLIHSAVQYEDGSVIAQIGPSDMRIAIQYALTYPYHLPSPAEPIDFTKLAAIDFGVPRNDVFKGLPLAYDAIRTGGSMTSAFNAANEWANARFREGKLGFLQIYDVIEAVMASHHVIAHPGVEEIEAIQAEADSFCEAHFA
ncbi:MAG: 1-deoxy-D-xylulose-5-phosphate reductoisomerase [Lachnospiraceae bacterium]|nr:1-deoxy-D-xylulose-5-phosphate reductoisomerase [Lachnospiraceae bacterium]